MINRILSRFGYQLIKMIDTEDKYSLIKDLLLKKGVREKDLANNMKLSGSAISNAVNGRRPQLQKKILEYLKSL